MNVLADTSNMIPAWVDGALQPVDKMEVHRKGLRHKAVSVFVLSGSKVLIQQRALSKYHTPGLWANTCCTHPLWGESDAVCALRRLREELGISGLSVAAAGQIEYRADVGGGLTEHELVEVFVAQASSDMAMAPNPDEVAATRWVDLYDLAAETRRWPEKFTPWLRIYMSDHMDRIFDLKALRIPV
jgi:isopentenyl-diphosphate Delta-isomerase